MILEIPMDIFLGSYLHCKNNGNETEMMQRDTLLKSKMQQFIFRVIKFEVEIVEIESIGSLAEGLSSNNLETDETYNQYELSLTVSLSRHNLIVGQ